MSTVEPFPPERRAELTPYLPSDQAAHHGLPHVTLTFATSIDSGLSLRPGAPTALSGPQSKSMTHYLRATHEAILVGVGTVAADDPSLGCRLPNLDGVQHQPRPVVIDPRARWAIDSSSAVVRRACEGHGLGVWILTSSRRDQIPQARRTVVESCGGKYIYVELSPDRHRMSWDRILQTLADAGIRSLMVEGGANVINDLLRADNHRFVKSVVVTIAPLWLGQGSVMVSPERNVDQAQAVARLQQLKWVIMGNDAVLCGCLHD